MNAATTTPATGVKRAVLLVDDDPDFLYQQKMHLERAGFDVITAACEREAEKVLAKVRPDLCVIDVMMENADGGFTLCHHIRKKDPTVPLILVTAINAETGMCFDPTSPEERSWIKADALLSKPIRFEQLKREIDRLLKVS